MKSLPKYESGQALLLVFLSMAVVLIVVLSILSRSITDIKITSGTADSLRAFSAAEAGIEQALIAGSIGLTSGTVGNATFNAGVSGFASGGRELVIPEEISSGDVATVWFVSHDADGNLTCSGNSCFTGDTLKVCWGKEGTASDLSTTPALEVSIFYAASPGDLPGDYSSIKIARSALDPNSSRLPANLFDSPDGGGCQIGTETLAFQKTLSLSSLNIPASSYTVQNGLQFAKLRILYNTDIDQPVGISANFASDSILPSQGFKIDSQGISGNSNRKVEVYESYPEAPLSFEMALYSEGGVTQ